MDKFPKWWAAALMAASLALSGSAALAQVKEAAPASADPVLEAKVMRIASELRCLVCQNETIAASHADLAVDLRRQVREMLAKGQSEKEILDFMTSRYGDFVLYRPPVKSSTWLLWFGPGLLMVGGLATLVIVLRRRARLPADQFEPDVAEIEDSNPRSNPSVETR